MRDWITVIAATFVLGAALYSIRPMYAALALLLPSAYAIVVESLGHARIRKIEEELPRALLELAAMPVHTTKDVIRYLSKGYGPLSEEFKKIDKMVASGIPPERAMESVARSSKSALFQNAITILVTGMRSGSRWSELLRSAAEDIESVIDMDRERRAALALQKYVTIASAGMFVPAALGITRRMVWKLAYGGGPLETNPVLNATLNAVWIHIALLALLASVFVALIEGNPRRAIFYSAITLPMAVGTYVLTGGIQI